ncbi:7439_t:CDS:2, partial [Acaulospora morrowiae]
MNFWDPYFDETPAKNWSTFQFHKNWVNVHKNEPEQLTYRKAMDTFFKSLRAIINRSSDLPKIWKANELLNSCQASTISTYPSDDLLDRCGCGIHNKEDTTFSCPSDDLLDRYDILIAFFLCPLCQNKNQRKAGSNMDNLWLDIGKTLKEKNINSLEIPIKKGPNELKQRLDFETEDKENTVGGSYKRRRTEGGNLEHSDNENFLNAVKSNDNENELERQAEETIQYNGKMWIVGNTKINIRDVLTEWQKRIGRPRADLAFYDIIDLTPGSNSDFIRSLPIDAMYEMKQFGSEEQQTVTDNVKELIIKFIKVYRADDLRKIVDESYLETRKNDTLKFVWDFTNLLAESIERDDDLADYDLSELAYREIFLAPAIR